MCVKTEDPREPETLSLQIGSVLHLWFEMAGLAQTLFLCLENQ